MCAPFQLVLISLNIFKFLLKKKNEGAPVSASCPALINELMQSLWIIYYSNKATLFLLVGFGFEIIGRRPQTKTEAPEFQFLNNKEKKRMKRKKRCRDRDGATLKRQRDPPAFRSADQSPPPNRWRWPRRLVGRTTNQAPTAQVNPLAIPSSSSSSSSSSSRRLRRFMPQRPHCTRP